MNLWRLLFNNFAINQISIIMKKIIFSIIVILFGLTSCKKSDSEERMITIKGIVLNCDNNEVFPNTEIFISRLKYLEEYAYGIESFKTNSNDRGEYEFFVSYNEKDGYTFPHAKKSGYFQKNRGPQDILHNSPVSDINNDTLWLGKASYLRIEAKKSKENLEFKIDLNKNIPSELFDSTVDYNANEYYIYKEDSITLIKESYLTKDIHEVYVTWSRYDFYKNKKYDDTTIVVQMNPSDTTFLSIDLQ